MSSSIFDATCIITRLLAWVSIERPLAVRAAPDAFEPPPKVTSAVLRLRVRTQSPVHITDRALFATLVREAFSQRRKTIRNALRRRISANQIEAIGIDPGARPETLALADFAALSNALSRHEPGAGARDS